MNQSPHGPHITAFTSTTLSPKLPESKPQIKGQMQHAQAVKVNPQMSTWDHFSGREHSQV